jgi:Uma2 family endonuclease
MATIATPRSRLTLEEFRERYAGEKPYYEYWFGEAIQKSVPTWLHALLQKILCMFLDRAGYESGTELELRIDPEWQPKPDVTAALVVEEPYPTHPVDIVAEVLSPEDRMSRVYEKCQHYARIGIAKIYVFDPGLRYAWEWNRETENLERISTMHLPHGQTIEVGEIWRELDKRRRSQ